MLLVTGGSGFIGSHLTENLAASDDVTIVDKNPPKHRGNEKIKYVRHDLCNKSDAVFRGAETVYHFAAYPDVKASGSNPYASFRNNVTATFNVLEGCRVNDVKKIIFASTSAVYGNATLPTREDHPIAPVSIYGATKAACESMIKAYHETYGIGATIMRYANVVGPRSTHGVIYDFVNKLLQNSITMEILGNGKQKKSYMHVNDCITATLVAGKTTGFSIFNAGSSDSIEVNKIASIVAAEMGAKNVIFNHRGGTTGWKGDVPVMMLETKKLRRLLWKPAYSSEDSVRDCTRWLVEGKK
ncbi:MAG TPA: NAD-dependent epimerase/dehydratase family protein [archaeon]|nr:NAD-dependent epimerase/dehydratase family protein [archaeon]